MTRAALLPLFVLPLFFLFFPFGAARAATPAEYARALGAVQAAVRTQVRAIRAEEVPAGDAPSLVARQALGPIRGVGLPGRPPRPVDSSVLIDAVAAAEATKGADARVDALEAVGTQMSLLRASLTAEGQGVDAQAVDAQAARRTVRETLARPEFASDPPPPPSFTEKIAAWIDRLLARRGPSRPASFPEINPDVILWILIAVAAAAFAVLVAVLVQVLNGRAARQRPLALEEEEATLMETRDNDSLLALAEKQAAAGDYRRAFRLVYLAALVALDTGGVLRFDRSRTNWEYLRALRAAGRGDIYAALTPLTREFDQVWYGLGVADAGRYARARAQYDALLAVGRPAPAEAGSH